MHLTSDLKAKQEVKDLGFENGLPEVDILELIPEFDITINDYTFLDGTSLLPDIALLKGLCKKFKDCDYLEIGSWRGESLINVAQHARSCVSISLSKDEMRQMNIDEKFIELDGYLIKDSSNITMIGHNSQTFDFKSLNKKFDLIFIDGDHAYDAIVNDTKNVFPLLKNENSIIVWHDCGNNYEDSRWEVIAGILEGTPPGKRKNLYRVSNSLCAIYSKEIFHSYLSQYPSKPNKIFDIQLKARKV